MFKICSVRVVNNSLISGLSNQRYDLVKTNKQTSQPKTAGIEPMTAWNDKPIKGGEGHELKYPTYCVPDPPDLF